MIIEWLLELGLGFVSWLLDLMVAPDGAFDFLSDVATWIGPIFAGIHGMGAWVPWPIVVVVVGAIFALWIALVGVKAVAWLKGLFWAGS